MLIEILKNQKNELKVEITQTYVLKKSEPQKIELNFVEIILDFLNQKDDDFFRFVEKISKEYLFFSERENIILNSKFNNESKKFLFLSLDGIRDKTPAKQLRLCLSFTNEIKQLLSIEKITNEEIIQYIEFKYKTKDNLAHNENYLLNFYNPLLFIYNDIDNKKYRKLLSKKLETNNSIELLEWIKPFVISKLHFTLFKKLINNLTRMSTKTDLANILNAEELIEYIRLKREYEEKCTKYKIPDLDETFIWAFVKLLNNGTIIKKCNRSQCGKFFIAKNNNAKACSDKCKKRNIEANKTKRKEDEYISKAEEATKKLQHRLDGYNTAKEPTENRKYALINFRVIYYYYLYVCKKVKKALRENTDNIREDEAFLKNFVDWLNKIADQKCDFKKMELMDNIQRIENVGTMKYYKFSKYSYETDGSKNLWTKKEFFITIKKKLKSKFKTEFNAETNEIIINKKQGRE
jgi:hypothetical protein